MVFFPSICIIKLHERRDTTPQWNALPPLPPNLPTRQTRRCNPSTSRTAASSRRAIRHQRRHQRPHPRRHPRRHQALNRTRSNRLPVRSQRKTYTGQELSYLVHCRRSRTDWTPLKRSWMRTTKCL